MCAVCRQCETDLKNIIQTKSKSTNNTEIESHFTSKCFNFKSVSTEI